MVILIGIVVVNIVNSLNLTSFFGGLRGQLPVWRPLLFIDE